MRTPPNGARATAPRARSLDLSTEPTRVLVVDDDALWPRAVRRTLGITPHFVDCVQSSADALRELERLSYDAIVLDIHLGGAKSGLDLLRLLRERGVRIPVILATGAPCVASAAEAVELGAFRYLTKPITPDTLRRAIDEAVAAGRTLPALAREASEAHRSSRRQLEDTFASALRTLEMAYQPILAVDGRRTVGFEALMRSREPRLRSPGAVIEAAEKLGTTHVLGRRVRRLVADAIPRSDEGATFFVNLHTHDLADADLVDPGAPLSQFARRVVLEVTERASLDSIDDVGSRVRALRALGYRLAIDDLGAGYAGLTSLVEIQPEVVKIDMSLVRAIDQDVVRQRVVLALAGLARSVGAEVVAEGVETRAERDVLVNLGCTYLQGYLLGRPAPAFPTGAWE